MWKLSPFVSKSGISATPGSWQAELKMQLDRRFGGIADHDSVSTETVSATSKGSVFDFRFGNGGAVNRKLFSSKSTSRGARRQRWNSEDRGISFPWGGSPLQSNWKHFIVSKWFKWQKMYWRIEYFGALKSWLRQRLNGGNGEVSFYLLLQQLIVNSFTS